MTATATARSGSFAPIKPITLGVIATFVGFVTWTFSSGSLPAWLPPLWSDTNAISRDSVLLVGPIVAGAGAWIGGWRHTLAIGPTPARGWTAIMSAQLRPLATAVVAGHVLGLTPAVVNAAANTTGGSANPLTIVSGLAAILAVTCLGYLLGTIWSSRIAPVVASIAVFPAIIGPILLGEAVTSSETNGTSGASVYGVALNWMDVTVGIGRYETRTGAAIRLALFAALAGAAAWVAVRSAGRRDTQPGWLAALPMLAPAAIAVAVLLVQPSLVGRSTGTGCDRVPESQVCVPDDVAEALPPIARGATTIIDQFGFGAATSDIAAGTPLSDLVSFTYFSDSPVRAESEASISTARLIGGELACFTAAFSRGGDDALNAGGSLELSYALASELSYAIASRSPADQADVDAAMFSFDTGTARALAALSDTELRTFLDQHSAELAGCTLKSVRQ